MGATGKQTGKKGRTAYGKAVERIRRLVESGEIVPGGRLPSERHLAEEFSVSRSCVREAIRTLVEHGVLEARRGAGTFLADRPQEEILERLGAGMACQARRLSQVFGFRRLLEPQLAREAVANATEAQLVRLRAVLERQGAAMAAGRSGRAEDREFHLLVAEATGNPIAVEAVRALAAVFDEPRAGRFESMERDRVSLDAHLRILEAFERRDQDAAARGMERHLREMEEFLCEIEGRD